MFHLLFNNVVPCTLDLEPKRVYRVNCLKPLKYGHSIYEYYGCSQKVIHGNNAVIDDQRTRQFVGYKTYDGVFLFSGCHDIKIEELHYQNRNEDFFELRDDKGEIRYDAGIEHQIGYVGTSYVLIQNDCSNFNIKCNIEGARYGIKVGDYSMFWLSGNYGLKNSVLCVKAKKTGYPVAIEIGDSLDVDVESDTHHRAAYLCGISNSKIHIKAKNILIAPLHCLLSDTHYSKRDKNTVHYKSCYNLEVLVEDLGTTEEREGRAFCIGFQTYPTNPFKQRKNPLIWENIHVKIVKRAYTKQVGLFSFRRSESEGVDDPRNNHDIFKNIYIEAYNDYPSSLHWEGEIYMPKEPVYQDVRFKIVAPYSGVVVDNKNTSVLRIDSSSLASLEYSGSVRTYNCHVKKKMPSVLSYSTIIRLYSQIRSAYPLIIFILFASFTIVLYFIFKRKQHSHIKY